MKTVPRRDSFAAMTDERYSDKVCPACGYGIRWGEATARDQNGKIFHADCVEEENMEHNIPADTVTAELIVVKQLPEIEERLRTVKESVNRRVSSALAMVCTEETLQAVKAERAKLNQEFAILEDQRKAAKKAVLEPYERFEEVYRDCVSIGFKQADEALRSKIAEVESEMKLRCEDGLQDYFAELCAVHHLDWLTYERAGIKVDMASAKAKTPKKLWEQLTAFVAGVAESVDRINTLEDPEEIMVEYQKSLNAADAICTVQERHRRIEDQKKELEARKAACEQEAAMVCRVEVLSPPVVMEKPPEKDPNEIIPKLTFTVINATRAQLRRVREFLNMEGIKYE